MKNPPIKTINIDSINAISSDEIEYVENILAKYKIVNNLLPASQVGQHERNGGSTSPEFTKIRHFVSLHLCIY